MITLLKKKLCIKKLKEKIKRKIKSSTFLYEEAKINGEKTKERRKSW